jgi:TonB family protein
MKSQVLLTVIALVFATTKALCQDYQHTRHEFVAAAEDSVTFQQVVQKAPQYVGGFEALYDYLLSNLRYPAKAFKKRKEGIVLVSFIVDRTDGHIRDAKVEKGVSKELDAEALHLVTSMPNWVPGKQNGRNIDVKLTLPVQFNLP